MDSLGTVCGYNYAVKVAGHPAGKLPIRFTILYHQVPNRAAVADYHGVSGILIVFLIVLQHGVVGRAAILEHPNMLHQILVVCTAHRLDGKPPQVALPLDLNVPRNAAAEKIFRAVLPYHRQLNRDILHACIQKVFLVLWLNQPAELKAHMIIHAFFDVARQRIQGMERR